MALDDATQGLIAAFRAAGRPPLTEQTPQGARDAGIAARVNNPPGPEMARVDDILLDPERYGGTAGSFRIRVLVPHGEVRAVFIFYHGGGWVLGDIDGHDAVGRLLAQETRSAVVMVDYRKAPEFRYPVAVQDSWAALQWTAANLDDIAAAGLPILVGGDSAGANLATIVARHARDEGGPQIALQVLIYPVTDANLETESYRDPANALLLSRESMIWFFDHYVPDVAQRSHPDVSPLQAPDLSGLPPAIILTAEHDVLRDEGEAYARALDDAGVAVDFERLAGQMHGFFPMVGILPGSVATVARIAESIDKTLASETAPN
ncbi:MAG: Esterase [Pseudonocardiales bacterium]|nr:Esterase [Pseudonocardiales bacterium]